MPRDRNLETVTGAPLSPLRIKGTEGPWCFGRAGWQGAPARIEIRVRRGRAVSRRFGETDRNPDLTTTLLRSLGVEAERAVSGFA